jgi:predicted transcriptional regulator
MTPRKKSTLEKPLTEVELELMNVIWDLGECVVKDVQRALPPDRELAYTSVATIIKILEQKGALVSTKGEKAHTYRPLLTRAEYEASSLRHLAKNLFHNDPSSMVMRLLSDNALSREELAAIRKVLDQRAEK